MSDRNDRGQSVADRMSRRFEDDESSERSENADGSDPSDRSESSGPSDNAGNAPRVQNVKEEWNGTYVYLPDEIDEPLDAEFDRLVYECGRDLSWKPKKNRHYYPLVVTDGIESIREMDAEAFHDRLRQLDLV
ncbi:hypothetical protein ACFQE1_05235 [Halobium palmae]|uniref:DUF8160 domain-containing protein n=1 Tax=Halobium palmae TaxID=1776492 RepID=A0ABD5RX74_9EURY